ncbi:TonB-dependent receptor [Sphingomonas phyllosphaerae]|uniref:TonB-dependent receptor n=1 Tax=Sphingomonas phyllosphaerae TaxID=257003 RepID=UPI002413305A|nr:TonB-dependent receptor [Sphingomonas phyllosphaerae]
MIFAARPTVAHAQVNATDRAVVGSADDTPQDIMVRARSAETARAEQRDAANIVNVQSAETIAKYPDYNAAEALGRIPGVSLSIDTGEGRFVNIRGLDGNLNGATFGGVVLLNTQPGGTYFNAAGRAVEFDTVPIGAVDRISVIKTGLPDHDAEGLGGSVELTPRSAIGRNRPFLDLTLGGGYQLLRRTGLYRADVTLGGGFGVNASGDHLFHMVVNLFRHDDRRGVDDVEAAYSHQQPTIPDKAFTALELRRYQYLRRRYGATGELDVTPDAGQRFFLRGSIAGYTERVERQRLEIDGLDGSNGSGVVLMAAGDPRGFAVTDASAVRTLRDEEEAHRNLLLQIGGEHHVAPSVRLDWFAALSRSTYRKYRDRNATFSGPGDGANPAAPFPITYDNTSDPNAPVFTTGPLNLADPANYVLAGVTNQIESDRDLEHSFAANVAISPNLVDGDEIKVGGKLRLRRKLSYVSDRAQTPATDGTVPLTDFSHGGDVIFYGGRYDIGPAIDPGTVASRFGGELAPLDLGEDQLSFDDREDVSAGYAQYTGRFGQLGVLAGVRVEHTVSRYGGYVTLTDVNGDSTPRFNEVRKSYTNLFPTLQLRYDLTSKLVARATYSTGVARPGFLQTIQSGQVDVGNQAVTTGNSNLRPTFGNNFDLSLEYYLPENGIISLGVFDKQFRDYIVSRTFRAPYLPYSSTAIFTYQSFENVSGAYARGVEANLVDRFRGLPAPLDAFGIDANATYVDSGVALRDGEASRALPGTFRFSGNATLFYERGGTQIRLAGLYDSKALFGIGGSTATDIYQDKRFTLDLYANHDLDPRVAIYATARNLLNTPLRFYEGSAERPIQREFYRQTFAAGVKIKI